jgi:thymidylate kinase
MQIISISGLDGSGKSTQIELLKNYLESQGNKVFYFHAIQFSLANRFKNKEDNLNEQKSVTKATWLQIQLRKLLLMIDIRRFNYLINKLEQEGFAYIVSDRYFYDSIINIEYLSLPEISPAGFRKQSFREPDTAIYIQVDPEAIMQRERKPDQGVQYLKDKKGLYDSAIYAWDMKVIDGNKSKEEIFKEIKNAVK